MPQYKVSLSKERDKARNEDAGRNFSQECATFIAVSDGAGGCGVYAGEWSQYLMRRLPFIPIASFEDFDKWIGSIWEKFYTEHERKALEADGIFLNKFYTEGSLATVAAAWKVTADRWRWISYGDSVVFHYNTVSKVLEHSDIQLSEFSGAPYLVSCKDPLDAAGFHEGDFIVDDHSIVFAATDALSHYMLMMYELSRKEEFAQELLDERGKPTYNAVLLSVAEQMQFNFEDDVLMPLLKSAGDEAAFDRLTSELRERKKILDLDDYTLVVHSECDLL